MKYMGSKARISKYILPIMLRERKEGQYYVEPFCGGCNSIDKVTGHRIAADKNKYLIAMWEDLVNCIAFIDQITKEIYIKARTDFNNGTNIYFTDSEIGWIGWMGSYNGRFFDGGYSGVSGTRDYISEQIRNTLSQVNYLMGVIFRECSYDDLDIPPNSIIYCDPPYKDTKQYSVSRDFDYVKFWRWCHEMSNIGHTVYVSEYNAPDGIECIWSMEVTNSMNTTKTYKPIEKLFRL